MDPTLRPKKPRQMRGTPAYYQRIRVGLSVTAIGAAVALFMHFSGFMNPFANAAKKYVASPEFERYKYLLPKVGHTRTIEQLREQRQQDEVNSSVKDHVEYNDSSERGCENVAIQDNNVEALPVSLEEQAVSAAFTSLGESICPLCGKVGLITPDHWKTCLQKFRLSPSRRSAPVTEDIERQPFFCEVCRKDLTHMNEVRRNQHVNRCIDSSAVPNGQSSDLSWECPFCRKMTIHKTRILHLKRCGTRQRVPFQKLLEILRMLDRQAAERQTAGLPLLAASKKEGASKPARTKTRGPKAQLEPRSVMEADLHMGVALSASLKEDADRRLKEELKQLGLDDYLIHSLPSTSLSLAAPTLTEPRRRKKGVCEDRKTLPMLLVRTATERHSIIAGKVQNVVLEGSSDEDDDALNYLRVVTSHPKPKCISDSQQENSQLLYSLISKDRPLTRLSATADPGKTDMQLFYTRIHPAISLSNVISKTNVSDSHLHSKWENKHFHVLSQKQDDLMPSTQVALVSLLGNSDEPLDDSVESQPYYVENNDKLNVSVSSDIALSGFCLDEEAADGFIREESSSASSKTLLEKVSNQLVDGVATMVTNKECSDVKIYTEDAVLPAHRFVLFIQCRELYQEVLSSGWSCSWSVSSVSARWFLTYLYAGNIDGLRKEKKHVLMEVGSLAKRYNIPVLLAYCDEVASTKESEIPLRSLSQTSSLEETDGMLSSTERVATENLANIGVTIERELPVAVEYRGEMESDSKLNGSLSATTKPQRVSEEVELEKECFDIATDSGSKCATRESSPETCILMEDSNSSLWSHNSDVMEIEKASVDVNTPSKNGTGFSVPVSECEMSRSMLFDNEDTQSHKSRSGDDTGNCKFDESKETVEQSRFVKDNSRDVATIAETTVNECMFATTDLFEEEPVSFVVPSTITCRKRGAKMDSPSLPSLLKDSVGSESTARNLVRESHSPSRSASTSTPLPQGSGPGGNSRVAKFYSVSSIEASPGRRVRISSSFEKSPPSARVHGKPRECSQNSPSSPQSPVFLSMSNTNCRGISDVLDVVEDSLARVSRLPERRTAHCISFNSDSDPEDRLSPFRSSKSAFSQGTPARRRLTEISNNGSRASLSPSVMNSAKSASTQRSPARRHLSMLSDDDSFPNCSQSVRKSAKFASPQRTSARRRLTDLSDNYSASPSRSLSKSLPPTPPPPPNSVCGSQESPFNRSKQILNSQPKTATKLKNSSAVLYSNTSIGDNPVDNDVWDDFNDDGGFSYNSPIYTEELVSKVGSPACASPRRRKLESSTQDQAQWKEPYDSPVFMSSQLTSSPPKRSILASPTNLSKPKIVSPGKKEVQFSVSSPNKKKKLSAKPKTPITPMPTYDAMSTPEIAGALKKYGVKQFPRKKAIPVLKHIYEETHPLVTDSEHESSFQKICGTPQQNMCNPKVGRSPGKKSLSTDGDNDDDHLVLSQSSSTSTSSAEVLEESYVSSGREEIGASQEMANVSDLSSFLSAFFMSRADLRHKILLYEPLNIVELQKEIKDAGMKHSMSQLMDFLDEQCITFTMGNKAKRRRRGRRPKGSTPSPKRKRKKKP